MITTTADHIQFGAEFFQEILEWIIYNYSPEEIYSETELKEWALDNGYTVPGEDY